MSIGVVCNLSDGVVLGVDSALTISGTVKGPTGETSSGVLNVYTECEKLFHLANLKAGVMFAGLAMLGDRTLESHVREWESATLAGSAERPSMGDVADGLHGFFLDIYNRTIVPAVEKETGLAFDKVDKARLPILQIAVAGFSDEAHLSEVWEITIPGAKPKAAREQGQFGANWYGKSEAIVRVIKGFEPALIDALLDRLQRKAGLRRTEQLREEVKETLRRFEAVVPYGGMPIGTGVEHVRFLLDLVIGYTDYVVGAPVCGGRTRIATVTREGFRWVAGHEPVISRLQADGASA
jgi:hypothetical protein